MKTGGVLPLCVLSISFALSAEELVSVRTFDNEASDPDGFSIILENLNSKESVWVESTSSKVQVISQNTHGGGGLKGQQPSHNGTLLCLNGKNSKEALSKQSKSGDLSQKNSSSGEEMSLAGQNFERTRLFLHIFESLSNIARRLLEGSTRDAPNVLFVYNEHAYIMNPYGPNNNSNNNPTQNFVSRNYQNNVRVENDGEKILSGLLNYPERDMCEGVKHWLVPRNDHQSGRYYDPGSGRWTCQAHHPCYKVTRDIFISKSLNMGVVHFHVGAIRKRREFIRVLRDILCNPLLADFELDITLKYASITPNDADYSGQWGLPYANIDKAWSIVTGADYGFPLVMVADTGTGINHTDIVSNLWINPIEYYGATGVDDDRNGYIDDVFGVHFSNGAQDGDVMDTDGHGSHCAGSIGASTNNNQGVAGISWGPKIVTCKFINNGVGYASDFSRCIDYAVKVGVQIFNGSFGGSTTIPSMLQSVTTATRIAFAFASGNNALDFDTSTTLSYPACYKLANTITTTALAENGSIIDYGNIGVKCVDIAAPGDYIWNLAGNSGYAYRGGTSMSAPYAAGIMALMLQINMYLTPAQLVSILKQTAANTTQYWGKVVTGGSVDAYAAVSAAKATARVSMDKRKTSYGRRVEIKPGEKVLMPVFLEDYLDTSEMATIDLQLSVEMANSQRESIQVVRNISSAIC